MTHVFDQLLNECVEKAIQSDHEYGEAVSRLEQTRFAAAHTPLEAIALSIVIPVYNAAELLERCIQSILAYTSPSIPIYLFDDASEDAATVAVLNKYSERYAHIHWQRSELNRGFVDNVNSAFQALKGDLILLNSDTQVFEGWSDSLQRCAYATDDVAVACPVSNHATLLTVADSPLLTGIDALSIADGCRQVGQGLYYEIPTAVGFCMYLRADALARVPGFDTSFAPGYGEEVDFSLKLRAHGQRIMACAECFVFHAGAASFGHNHAIQARRDLHERIIHQRWPHYEQEVRSWWRDYPLRSFTEQLKGHVRQRAQLAPRILHVTHRIGALGGTEIFVGGLLERTQSQFPASLVCVGKTDQWSDMQWLDGGTLAHGEAFEQVHLNADYRLVNQYLQRIPADLSNPWTERKLAQMLQAQDIGLVHIHYMLGWDSLILPLIAKRMGLPVVLSLHCFHFVCPDYNQIEQPQGRFCQRRYAGEDEACIKCLSARHEVSEGAKNPPLNLYLQARHHFARQAFAAADVVISPSHFNLNAILQGLGLADDPEMVKKCRVIEHGVESVAVSRRLEVGEKLSLMFTGGANAAKGYRLIHELIHRCADLPIEFHLVGALDDGIQQGELPSSVITHGPLAHADLLEQMANVDALLLPSLFAESFSIVLSEAWACGVVPVVARRGALGERVKDGVNGLVLPADSIEHWYACLCQLCTENGRNTLLRLKQSIAQRAVKSMDENAEEYVAIYRQLLAGTDEVPCAEDGQAKPVRSLKALQTYLPQPVSADTQRFHPRIESSASRPRVVAIIDLRRGHSDHLQASIDSVIAQCELVVLLTTELLELKDPSNADSVHQLLVDDAGFGVDFAIGQSIKIRLESLLDNQGADWLLWLDSGDAWHFQFIDALGQYVHGDAAIKALYCDYDHCNAQGQYYSAVRKPDRDAVLALCNPYPIHGLAVRWSWWRSRVIHGLDERACYLALVQEMRHSPECIRHLPQLWYHRYDANIASDCELNFRRDLGMAALESYAAKALLVMGGTEMGWRPEWPEPTDLSLAVCIWCDHESMGVVELAQQLREAMAPHRLQFYYCIDGVPPESINMAPNDYVVHVHEHLRGFERESWQQLLAWALHLKAAVLTPGIRQVTGATLDLSLNGGFVDLQSQSTAANRKVVPSSGLGVVDLSTVVTSHPDVQPLCVLIDNRQFDDDNAYRWPTLNWQQRRAAYPKDQLAIYLHAVQLSLIRYWLPESYPGSADDHDTQSINVHNPWRWRDYFLTQSELHPLVLRHIQKPPQGLKVVAIAEDEWAGSQYRLIEPLHALSAVGVISSFDVTPVLMEGMPSIADLAMLNMDCLLWFNRYELKELDVLEQVSEQLKIPCVLLIDDLITQLPPQHPLTTSMPEDLDERVRRAARLCQHVVVTSEALAKVYADIHEDIRVIPNSFEPKRLNSIQLKHEPICSKRENSANGLSKKARVLWAGAAQHDHDLAFLQSIVERTQNDIDWVVMGSCSLSLRDLVTEYIPAVAYSEYLPHLASLNLDFAVAPLVDHPFNRCKSHLKVLEYSALGLPVIASRIEPYLNTPAYLVDNTMDDWVQALTTLSHNIELRDLYKKRAAHWLDQQALQQRLDLWQSAFCPQYFKCGACE
jgi:glycosyltransferase involved in cell wall biosynthesis